MCVFHSEAVIYSTHHFIIIQEITKGSTLIKAYSQLGNKVLYALALISTIICQVHPEITTQRNLHFRLKFIKAVIDILFCLPVVIVCQSNLDYFIIYIIKAFNKLVLAEILLAFIQIFFPVGQDIAGLLGAGYGINSWQRKTLIPDAAAYFTVHYI